MPSEKNLNKTIIWAVFKIWIDIVVIQVMVFVVGMARQVSGRIHTASAFVKAWNICNQLDIPL